MTGLRRARYRGLPKTRGRLEHVFSVVELNLIRLDAYWNSHPPGPHQNQPPRPPRTRPDHLIELTSRVTYEPKRLRLRILAVVGRIVRTARPHPPTDEGPGAPQTTLSRQCHLPIG